MGMGGGEVEGREVEGGDGVFEQPLELCKSGAGRVLRRQGME